MGAMQRRVFILGAVAAAWLRATRTDYENAVRKFDGIQQYRFKAGSRVPISLAELNAYVQTELPEYVPAGVRNPRIELGANNTATGYAQIDFVKLRSAQGKPPGWLLRKLLQGERDVSVTCEVRSANGVVTVYPTEVEIEGVPISGAALDFLIHNYLLPNYPNAKIAQPIRLKYGMDRFEVYDSRVDIVLKNRLR